MTSEVGIIAVFRNPEAAIDSAEAEYDQEADRLALKKAIFDDLSPC